MTQYYDPQGFALDIFRKRYALHENESWVDACDRVSNHIAAAENGESITKHRAEFSEMLKKNLFMPGGRIWFGSGRPKGQLLNCFVVPTADSREGWGKTSSDMIIISGTGGGLGVNFSPIRPRNSLINGSGGLATGATSLMEILDAAGNVIKAGGGRRVAMMFALHLNHGDIMEFLDKKLDLKKLNNANVSIVFNENPEDFFERVKNDEDFELKFRDKVVGTVSAKQIWGKIISNSLKCGEPGLLNSYYANKMNNLWYNTPLICTNPCVTGDTLIATADGRNAVSIKQLADEGKDIPVYSTNPFTGKIEVKLGVNPRVTGLKKEVWKLTLDDGSVIRATPDHKFLLRDLTKKELKDLKPGDSLKLQTKWKTNWKEVFGDKCNSKSQDYWATHDGSKMRFEHSIFAEFNEGRELYDGEIVHHINFQGLDNSAKNLKIMTKEDHDLYHAKLMMGEKNPYHKMSNEWKENFAKHPGRQNGMYGRENKWGHHSVETKEIIRLANVGRKHSDETKKLLSLLKKEQTKKKYELAGIPQYVEKECKGCLNKFTVHWSRREQMYHSKNCFLKFFNGRKESAELIKKSWQGKRDIKRDQWLKLYTDYRFEVGRDLKKKEWEDHLKSLGLPHRFSRATFYTLGELKDAASDYNHRVISVEFDCFEDVYNITVEDNHNFAIVLPIKGKTKTDKEKQYHIFTPQCGEIWLASYDCCCLGAVVLPRFITDGRMDWQLLKETVTTSVRFLDNVLTVNNYPLAEIKETCSSIRRVGLGVMGLATMLLKKGYAYNSPDALEFVDKVMAFIKNSAYEASIELAKEKGSFPKFDARQFLKSGFAKTLKPTIRDQIRKHGMRNCALLTIAPTGTTSMVSDVDSGIEPNFGPGWTRRYQDGEELKSEIVIHPLFRKMYEEGKDVSHFQSVSNLKMRDHFEMQRTCQKHIDNAVSKTVNVPQGTSEDELSELYMEFFPELKGATVYPEGSRENQPITPFSIEEALKHLDSTSSGQTSADACRNGVCEL